MKSNDKNVVLVLLFSGTLITYVVNYESHRSAGKQTIYVFVRSNEKQILTNVPSYSCRNNATKVCVYIYHEYYHRMVKWDT